MASKLYFWKLDMTGSYGPDTIVVMADGESEARLEAAKIVEEVTRERSEWMDDPEEINAEVALKLGKLTASPFIAPAGALWVRGSD